MCLYLRTKFQVSSFIKGEVVLPSVTLKQIPKNLTKIKIK